MASIDFLQVLLIITVCCGLIWFIDAKFWASQRKLAFGHERKPFIVEQARAFFPIFLIVLLIRSFLVQPFRVPTGSLLPTVVPGDFLAVNQFAYGLRLPVWHKKILKVGNPKLGDVVVFRWPVNPKIDYVKRVVGVPGDRISYVKHELIINGVPAKQTFLDYATDGDGHGNTWTVKRFEENLNGVKHKILIRSDAPQQDFYNLVVPKGYYLMMGDNRDNSDDGRYWGFVSEKALIGKAFLIWLSWDSSTSSLRWRRSGTWI